jgi:uncharacterized membrane protein
MRRISINNFQAEVQGVRKLKYWIYVIFVMVACLQSQTFMLPVFIWSFVLLFPIWILRWVGDKNLHDINRYNILLIINTFLLILLCVNSARLESAIFLISSVWCGVMAFIICLRQSAIPSSAAGLFIIIHLALATLTAVCKIFDVNLDTLILSERGDSLRFRGLAMEPNHLGFSLCAGFLILLYDPLKYFARKRILRYSLLIFSQLMALWTKSPFAILMMSLILMPYLWATNRGRIFLIILIGIGVYAGIQSERIEDIINGEDSSANFRTWGSLLIGYLQIEKCGVMGCGLGNSRNILESEPLMTAFAAQEILVLPNLFAGAMVDGGFVLLSFVFVSLLMSCFPQHPEGRFRPISMALFALMVAYSASGSYPYDPHYWAALGMLAAVNRMSFINNLKK